MCKASTLFNQIISKYHPIISKDDKFKEMILSNIRWFNIEALIEDTMAAVGGYKFIDGKHHDFSDGTECKTGSVRATPSTFLGDSYITRISNIESGAGVTKGSIRAVIYNPIIESCVYFYIPSCDLNTKITLHHLNGDGTVKYIGTTWNKRKNSYNKLDPYRVKDFETLAKM